MGDKTGIEWTDATWNPVTGCTKVSPGCDNCYAATLAERFRGTTGHYFEDGFDVQLRPNKLDQPLRWKKPRRIFVNSMSDLFHKDVPAEYIAKVFAVMAVTERHTFQVLTKRPARMRSLMNDRDFRISMWEWCSELIGEPATDSLWNRSDQVPWPLPNVWLGVSAEDQKWADIRIPTLLDTPAAVRFISAEPLLGPIDLVGPGYIGGQRGHGGTHNGVGSADCPIETHHHHDMRCKPALDWVIVGGESGRDARPMHPAWPRSLLDQCAAAEVPFHFKQWGEWVPFVYGRNHPNGPSPWANREPDAYVRYENGDVATEDEAIRDGGTFTGVYRVGKKAAGRELEGSTWDGYPERAGYQQ